MNLKSRAWRLSNLYAIKPSEGPIEKFRPNAAQRHYFNNMHLCNHILKARKLGFSTFNMMDASDALLFTTGIEVGIIDYSLPDAKKKLAMIKLAYDNLDNVQLHGKEQASIGAMIKRNNPMRYSKTEITFGNGSVAYCGVSLRGTTPNRLYISELGKTSIFAPIKAQEIRTGALNSLTPGNVIVLESTHEGGKFGLHYELLETAMSKVGTPLSPIDFKFFFYPWWLDPRYVIIDDRPLRPQIVEYFAKIEPQLPAFCAQHGFPYIPLTHFQKRWYDIKEEQQRHGMKKEFPSLPGEAFESPSDNSIYGTQMADCRAAGRVIDFNPCPHRAIFSFWDLGVSDFTAIWLNQLEGKAVNWLNWHEDSGLAGGEYVKIIRQWEHHYSRKIDAHFLPHDAALRDKFSATTYADQLKAAGLQNIIIVPRTPDIWNGINEVRRLLPNSFFHKTNCDSPRVKDGQKFPSGVACLEGYQRRISRDGMTIQEAPWHNQFSHTADAARTFGEASLLNMIPSHDSSFYAHQPITIKKINIRR